MLLSNNRLRLLVATAGGLLQHAGDVPGGAGAADPGSRRVLQERGAAARFDHR